MVSVSSRAHRTLRNLKSFRKCDSSEDVFGEVLPDAGEVVGVYENSLNNKDENLIITEKGIFSKTGRQWEKILFKEILDVSSPQDKDSDACMLSLKMINGVTKILPIKGGDGRFRDVYSFHRFIIGVLADLES